MSDWEFLNRNRVTWGEVRSTSKDGFNGVFLINVGPERVPLKVIASNGLGWQHVSVSQAASRKVPNWDMMCAVKDLFWEPEDWVVQFHPAKTEYVNNCPGCLHLWRPTHDRMPTPPSILVGIKHWGELK